MKLTTPKKRGWRYYRNLLLFTLGSILFAFYVVLPIGFAAQDARSPARFAVCCVSPADLDLPYEDVTFRTSDGLILSGWYIPSQNGTAIIAAHARGEIKFNRIYYAVAGEPKQLWELPDSTHIRGLFSHPEEYQDKVLTFFDQALLPGNAN